MIRHGLSVLRLQESQSHDFVSMGTSRTGPPPVRDRAQHASRLLGQVADIELSLSERNKAGEPTGVLLEVSGPTLHEKAGSLQDVRSGIELLLVGEENRAIIRVAKNIDALKRKISDYATKDTVSNRPKNQDLVARIESIAFATLNGLSIGEIDDDDVDVADTYVVEIWLPKQSLNLSISPMAGLAEFVTTGASTIMEFYSAVDRDVALVRLTGEQLLALPQALPFVSEIHYPDRVVIVNAAEAMDLAGETLPVDMPPAAGPVVAIHDVGIAWGNPYIDPLLISVQSAVPGQGTDPVSSAFAAHGAEMAGIAAYGDLTPHLRAGKLTPSASIISVKLLSEDDEPLWAERTRLAVEIAENAAQGRPIVHNLSIGAPNIGPGARSIWSIAIDELAWNGGAGRLIVVAAGNRDQILNPDDYPNVLFDSLHDQPGQAWNAITVGGITEFSELGPEDVYYRAPAPLAASGQVSPYTTVGPGGNRPVKPDVVAEAGNTAPGGGLGGVGLQGLSIITTASPEHSGGRLLSRAWATSAAAAQTSNYLARIAGEHLELRPATIRALLVHSADPLHTSATQFADKSARNRTSGFGMPRIELAGKSSTNRPILIHEGSIAPRRSSGGHANREAIFIELPFDSPVLSTVEDNEVRLSVTLSYFMEPTASLIRRDYAGARLKWDIQGPLETPQSFESRINKLVRAQGVSRGEGSYTWDFGDVERSRGTLQHDSTLAPVSAVIGSRLLAVYPVLGWWDGLKDAHRRTLDFSVVVSLDFGEIDVDVYTSIAIALSIEPEVEIESI